MPRVTTRAALVGAVFGCSLLFLGPETAQANGRFPRAQVLRGSGDALALGATFGLILSIDRGQSFYYVCEEALLGAEASLSVVDLYVDWSGEETLVSGSALGLRVSRDRGCSWETDPALPVAPSVHEDGMPNPLGFIVDVVRHTAKSEQALIVAATLLDEQRLASYHELYAAPTGARDFRAFGPRISVSEELSVLHTLEAAKADAERLYLTGFEPESLLPSLWVSRDGGESWTEKHTLSGFPNAAAYIAGVSPLDPDLVFVRLKVPSSDPKADVAFDAFAVSNDGGKTFDTLLQKHGKALGFALSPDGSTALLGFGKTGDPGEVVVEDELGIYRVTIDGLGVEQISRIPTTCLTWNENGVYACGVPKSDFVIGYRANADFDLDDETPFSPVLADTELHGPLIDASAPNGCAGAWWGTPANPGVCQLFSACETAGAGGSGTVGWCGGPGGDGGTGGEGGVGGDGGEAGSGTPPGNGSLAGGKSSTCGCRLEASTDPSSIPGYALALVALARGRRVRRSPIGKRRMVEADGAF